MADADPSTGLPPTIWERIKEHKILQWGLGYFGAALAVGHCSDLLSHTFHWPEIIQRIILGMLIVGFPLALTLAWFHGHKGLRDVSQGELAIASILIVIGAGLLIVLARAPSGPVEAPPAALKPLIAVASRSDVATAAAPHTAIAVMPFVNLTGDASKDYLGDGMAEELIITLAKVPGLRVPARTSTFSYKGRNTDVRQIGRDLQVGTVLEGSVRISGKQLRITAELIDAQSDSHLWSDIYQRELTEVFKIEDELAAAIVQALQVNLKGASLPSVARAPPTRDIEAYTLYLRARQIGHLATESSLRESIGLLEQAVKRDPNFARAYSAHALRLISLRDLGYAQPNALEDAELDAVRALALDPTQAAAQSILGIVHATRGDWLKSETSFRTAMAQDPGEPEIIDQYCLYLLLPTGHLRQALAELERARRLAPAELFALGLSMAFNTMIGRDEEALKFADLATALGWTSDSPPLQTAYSIMAQRQGHYAEAADHYLKLAPTNFRSAGGDEVIKAVYEAFGDPAKRPAAAESLRGLLKKLSQEDQGICMQLCAPLFFSELDDLDAAFEFAHQHYEQLARAGGSAWSNLWSNEMQAFRRDPRFQSLAARLKLMDHWQKYGPPDDCDLKDGRLSCH